MTAANLTAQELSTLLRDPSSAFAILMEQTVKPMVYNFYKDKPFCTKQGQQQTAECSFRQIAYGQWATGAITDSPMFNME